MTGVERMLFTIEDTERPAGELGTMTTSQPEDILAQPEVAPSSPLMGQEGRFYPNNLQKGSPSIMMSSMVTKVHIAWGKIID